MDVHRERERRGAGVGTLILFALHQEMSTKIQKTTEILQHLYCHKLDIQQQNKISKNKINYKY